MIPKFKLKQDLVIPAGTIFETIDGRRSKYISGNYECSLGLSKDTSGSLIYGIEDGKGLSDWFEEVT